jgi:hypothetical protein
VWFIGDYNGPDPHMHPDNSLGLLPAADFWVRGVVLDENGDNVLRSEIMFAEFDFFSVLEVKGGPDGALYINNYAGWSNSNQNTNISRVEYTGDCHPAEPKLETVGCMDPGYEEYNANAVVQIEGACLTAIESADMVAGDTYEGIHINDAIITVTDPGDHVIEITDIKGKPILSRAGTGTREYRVPEFIKSGIFFITVRTPRRSITGKFMNMGMSK